MWALIGGVFATCLALFLFRSADSFPEAETAFQQLLSPTQIVAHPLSPEDLPRVPAAQAAFASHTSGATVTARHIEGLMSPWTPYAFLLKTKVFAQDSGKLLRNRSSELARCALALEGLGTRAEALIPMLATNFLATPGSSLRSFVSGVMLGYVGRQGEQLLLRELANPDDRIRASAVDGLRHRLFRQTTEPDRTLPIEVAPEMWAAVTTGQGLFNFTGSDHHRSGHWENWGRQSAWMFSTNGVWLWESRLQELRAPTRLITNWDIRPLIEVLKTNQVGVTILRSNFVSVCIELTQDASPTNYGRGFLGLAELGFREPREVAVLEAALSHSDPRMRAFAARELQKLRPPEKSP